MKIESDKVKQLRSDLVEAKFGRARLRVLTKNKKETRLAIKALYSLGLTSINHKDISNKSALTRRWNDCERRKEFLIVEVDLWNLRHLWNSCIILNTVGVKVAQSMSIYVDFRTFIKEIKEIRRELKNGI